MSPMSMPAMLSVLGGLLGFCACCAPVPGGTKSVVAPKTKKRKKNEMTAYRFVFMAFSLLLNLTLGRGKTFHYRRVPCAKSHGVGRVGSSRRTTGPRGRCAVFLVGPEEKRRLVEGRASCMKKQRGKTPCPPRRISRHRAEVILIQPAASPKVARHRLSWPVL